MTIAAPMKQYMGKKPKKPMHPKMMKAKPPRKRKTIADK